MIMVFLANVVHFKVHIMNAICIALFFLFSTLIGKILSFMEIWIWMLRQNNWNVFYFILIIWLAV